MFFFYVIGYLVIAAVTFAFLSQFKDHVVILKDIRDKNTDEGPALFVFSIFWFMSIPFALASIGFRKLKDYLEQNEILPKKTGVK